MFNLTHKLPRKCWIACSGGVDSVSALHWLATNPNRVAGLIYVNHGTGEYANKCAELVRNLSEQYNTEFRYFKIVGEPPKGTSKEAWWRDQRYSFFEQVEGKHPIVLAHQFDDCLEEYLMCVLVRGFKGTIPYAHGRCIRPFRLWKRQDILDYAKRENLKWLDDPSNQDTKFKRNYIRQNIVPNVLNINQGIYNIVKQTILEQESNNGH